MSEKSIIRVKIIPQGSCNKVEKVGTNKDGDICLNARVTASPVDGKANQALIKLLADYYDIPKSMFQIKSGWSSRSKVIIVNCSLPKITTIF